MSNDFGVKAAVKVVKHLVTHTDGTVGPDEDRKDGYFVGGVSTGKVFEGYDHALDYLDEIGFFIEQVASRRDNVGIWRDPEDGKLYLDESEWVGSKRNAIAKAQSRGELAIWDVKGECEVRVGLIVNGNYFKMTKKEN